MAVAVAALIAGGCEEVEQLRDQWRPQTPHEAYLAGLHDAGLATTALSQEWISQAALALREPRPVELPYQEEGFIPSEDPTAVGYRFQVRRGQVFTVALFVESEESTRVFLDVFRAAEDPSDPARPLLDADSTEAGLRYEPSRDGEFIVRVQPELLRGGRYRLTLDVRPALAFPVEGGGTRDIGSVFGDPRDAGARSHHGVDIFAARGTPVLASSEGVVRRANETRIGGKVVWLRDDRRNRNIYYAHLDSQYVRAGQRVEVGDTVGFVGNTGNARTTPPHLHYGLYVGGEGPTDPFPFLRPAPGTMPEFPVDPTVLGQRLRSRSAGVRLRAGPHDDSEIVAELEEHAPLRVLGGSADRLRVALPDGRHGYLPLRLTEAGDEAVAQTVASADRPAQARPWAGAPVTEILRAGISVPVLGSYAGYLLVRGPSGLTGWVQAESQD
jgi:murein DD-endopeptidase MepM/ murein hydrolase activator NlpD